MEIIKHLFLSLIPVQALAIGIPAINTLLSSLIIGNVLGTSALAAIGFTGPFIFVVTGFSSLIGTGAQILCGKHLGKGDENSVKKAFNTAGIMCLFFGLLLVLVTSLFPTSLAKILGATGELQTMTSDYLKGYSLCCMFSIFFATYIPFLQLDCAKLLSTVSIITLVALNILLNEINVFILHWGMFGAGLAASISSAVSVFICLPFFAKKSKIFSFDLKSFSFSESKEICTLGINSAIIFVWLTFRDRVFIHTLMKLGGPVAISAFTIANTISNSIGCTIEGGTLGSCNIVSSVLVGNRDIESLRDLPKVMIKSITPMFAAVYVLIFIVAKPFALAFGAEPEHIMLYVLAIRFFNGWYFTNTIKTAALSIYNSLNKIKLTAIFNFLGLLFYPVGVYCLSNHLHSIWLLFSSTYISEILLIITFYIYYCSKMKSFPKHPFDYVYIPRDFAPKKEDCLALTVKTNEDAVRASETAIDFCKKKGLAEKKSYYCGLCIEEMTMDTISRVFPKSKNKSCSIDVRITYENNKITVMLRDDCNYFNPNEWLELYSKDNPLKSIGIKMTKQLSDEMVYKNLLGLNVLNISFSF